jgi:ABC-2 type transport system permease protein
LIASAVVVTAAGTLLIIATGVIGYGVAFPADRWLPLAVVVAVAASSFCALGLAVAPFVPTVEAVEPIIFGTLLPLLFISGAFIPVDPTSWIGHIAAIFPVRHLVDAALEVFDLRPGGGTIAWGHLAIVTAWGIAGAAIATRWYRWDRHNH